LSLMGQYAFRELDHRVPVHFKVTYSLPFDTSLSYNLSIAPSIIQSCIAG